MARRLLSKMRKTGNPKPGVLFQIIYREAGTRKICLLKLAWFEETYFDYDETKSSLKKRELLEKLPYKGRFQKGAIYPHPNKFKPEAYMKVYQKDTEANYFDDFLGGFPEISGRDIVKEIKRLAKSITGTPLTLDQNLGLYQGISDHLKNKRKQVKDTDITRIIQDALHSESNKEIKELVNDDLKVTGIVDGKQIQDLKMSFRVGGIRLSGSYSQVKKRFKFEGAGPNKHSIQGRVGSIELGSR